MIRIKTEDGVIINPTEADHISIVDHDSMMCGERVTTEEAEKCTHTPTLKEYQERGNCTEWTEYLKEVEDSMRLRTIEI